MAPLAPLNKNREYLLESRWSYDHSHHEFATISVEESDGYYFEDLLDPSTSDEDKRDMLQMINDIYDAQVPGHGNRKLLRLFRVQFTEYSGYQPGVESDGTITNEMVSIKCHLVPLFDFDHNGQPKWCSIYTDEHNSYMLNVEYWVRFLRESWVDEVIPRSVIDEIRGSPNIDRAREIAIEFHNQMLDPNSEYRLSLTQCKGKLTECD